MSEKLVGLPQLAQEGSLMVRGLAFEVEMRGEALSDAFETSGQRAVVVSSETKAQTMEYLELI